MKYLPCRSSLARSLTSYIGHTQSEGITPDRLSKEAGTCAWIQTSCIPL
ncbi:hypothetical protein FOPG_20052 [Fusarium oxysporum f. sp. conglutinans race 2 54008]|uniref:Uncharacterized protein n=1 Tax=Fusarium oxysporum f. sp. conglutinans race 2 54008 TaxID=1089457 RepID=X0GUS8_FUSOX|nr:hypothetical protein FOPG_20052 [Fusarium oxysporum f. sp. conglutinans race 2 54008]